MRVTLKAQIQDLSISLWNSKAGVELECRRKERALAASQVTPKIWEEKCQETENAKDQARYQKDKFESMQGEILEWMNEREDIKANLDAYKGTIYFLHVERDGYHENFTSLVEFCNWLTRDMPWKLRDALEDLDKNNTHPSVGRYFLFYEDMMQRFNGEMKELKGLKSTI